MYFLNILFRESSIISRSSHTSFQLFTRKSRIMKKNHYHEQVYNCVCHNLLHVIDAVCIRKTNWSCVKNTSTLTTFVSTEIFLINHCSIIHTLFSDHLFWTSFETTSDQYVFPRTICISSHLLQFGNCFIYGYCTDYDVLFLLLSSIHARNEIQSHWYWK